MIHQIMNIQLVIMMIRIRQSCERKRRQGVLCHDMRSIMGNNIMNLFCIENISFFKNFSFEKLNFGIAAFFNALH